MQNRNHDVLIIGGGISGTALLYELARFTDLKNLCLLEKYSDVALVNSHGRNNSQTLHCGDIETNYTLEKALQVQASARMVVNYVHSVGNPEGIMFQYPKMILGVGEQECGLLRERYKLFKPHYTGMQLLTRQDIEKWEPNVALERSGPIAAIGVRDDYSTVNFNSLAGSFLVEARKATGKDVLVEFDTRVKKIEFRDDAYHVTTNHGEHHARMVVVSAGGQSLLFAQRLGYGMQFSCLPVAGSFYYTPQVLRGKVYTIQNDKLPFAAIHGDPDILVEGKTRFGPTALVLPQLERYNLASIPEFLSIVRPDAAVAKVMWDLIKEGEIRRYMLKNMLFEVPLVRSHLFLKDARKIIPSLKLADLEFAHKVGGVRPVMIDKEKRKLHLGEAKINSGKGIIFNMTPSPGATSCLANAERDARIITDYLGRIFYEDEFNSVLKKGA